MVHLDSGVADTRGFGIWTDLYVNAGGTKLPNRGALTEYMIALADVQAACTDSTTNKRKETNINARVVW